MGNQNFLGILLNLSFIMLVSGQGCLRVRKRGSSIANDDPPFSDNNNPTLPAKRAVQAIITTYKLYCDCVNITSWETYVWQGGNNHNEDDITFQVWRPSPTVLDDGCYSLVGENVFTSFTFEEGGLVQLTPTPPSNSIITAQSGDVVGYYTNSRNNNNQGIQLERDEDYDENIIWFLSVAEGQLLSSGNNACPYPVGTGKYLSSSTGAAPLLKISSTTVSCPPSLRLIPSLTFSQPEQSSTSFIEVSTSVLVTTSNMLSLLSSIHPTVSRVTASSPGVLEMNMSPMSPLPTTEYSNDAFNYTVMATINNLQTSIYSSVSGSKASLRVLERNTSYTSSQPNTENCNGSLNSIVMATISVLAATMFISTSVLTLIVIILIARKIKKYFVTDMVAFREAPNSSKDCSIGQVDLQYEIVDTDLSKKNEDYSTITQAHNTPFTMMSNEAYAVHKKKTDDFSLVTMNNAVYAVHKKD